MFEGIRNIFKYEGKREAEKHSGAASRIKLSRKKEAIGHGHFGNVDSMEVKVGDRERKFVRKTFKENGTDRPEDSLKNSLDMYALLKNTGIRNIPTTYRKISDTEVLMTDLNTEGKIALSTHHNNKNNVLIKNESIKIESIDIDFIKNLIDKIKDDLRKATQNGIIIPGDAYMFRVPSKITSFAVENSGSVDVVIGDFDDIRRHRVGSSDVLSPIANINTKNFLGSIRSMLITILCSSAEHEKLDRNIESLKMYLRDYIMEDKQ